MNTPEELLCRRSWRLRNSVWTLWGILSAGIFWWVGFAIIGWRARNRTWLALAGLFLIPFILMMVVDLPTKDAPSTPLSEAVSNIMLLSFFAGGVLAFLINRKWLVWRATHGRRGPWYARATANEPSVAGFSAPIAGQGWIADVDAALNTDAPSSTPEPPAPGPFNRPPAAAAPGSTQPDSSNSSWSESGTLSASIPLDINTATPHEIAALPGFDPASANHIVATRERLGGFAAPSDLVTAAGVQPHIFAGVRNRLTTSPTRQSPQSKQGEAPKGRRLEF